MLAQQRNAAELGHACASELEARADSCQYDSTRKATTPTGMKQQYEWGLMCISVH